MSETLTGRALDEAVALAMGWTQHRDEWPHFLPEFTWIRPGNSIPEELPEFSEDAEALPEMLAWLQSRKDYSSFNACSYREDERTWPWAWSATFHYVAPDSRLNVTGHGASLSEAVANLVILVAEDEKS